MADETNLPATQAKGALARPSFLSVNDVRGSENITKDDIQMPRMGLAQALSPQIEDGNAKQIPNLRSGQLFNNLTGDIYGKGPIEFTVIRADKPRFIEFNPRDAGGGIKDFDVPANDPRTQFTTGADGKSIPPLATKFYDFIILLLPVSMEDPMSNLIALSLKSTGLKVARQLNGLIKMRSAPSFAGKYKLSAGTEKNPKGTFSVYLISNSDIKSESSAVDAAGNILPGWVSGETFTIAEQLYESLKDKHVTIEREPGDDDATFNTNEMEASPAM